MARFEELGTNSGLVEELYQQYLRDPSTLDAAVASLLLVGS